MHITYTAIHEKDLKICQSLWNEEYSKSYPISDRLFIQNSPFSALCKQSSSFAFNEHGEMVGFILVKVQNNNHYIHLLFVKKAFRNKGIGTALLKKAENDFSQFPIFVGTDMYHYFPGIPLEWKDVHEWFEKRGYTKDEPVFDMKNEYSPTEPSPSIQSPYTIQFASLEDKEPFLSFLQQHFGSRWHDEAVDYFQAGGTGKEFSLLKDKGSIIGFVRHNQLDSPLIGSNLNWAPLFHTPHVGGIGPLGIDPAYRKQGLGEVIVNAAIVALQKSGITTMLIDWTHLVDFYKKFGYDVWKSYIPYKKINE
ncbi:GNAT family N-acetyltransferase [Alkalihalobacterium bogoriense]|uniref:GNAT family N-acetyltransferase n=1 Tax=Alkalihalobacterium bogoriense TaxID=246272 RepID=UPI00068630EC|nr:GNAT family N-acetyltransferase [Alkalihalobacterium bogoriense]